MLNFLRRILGNGEKIAIGNKICIGIMVFFYIIIPLPFLFESCGYEDAELSKQNELSELKDNFPNFRSKLDNESALIRKEVETLQARLNEIAEKYKPYRAELEKRKEEEEERNRKAEALAKQAEVEEQLKQLDIYPSLDEVSALFASPNLMKRELTGQTIVMHGQIKYIHDADIAMVGWFAADGDVHEALFHFLSDSSNLTSQCREGDYVLITGLCFSIKNKKSSFGGTVGIKNSTVLYNFGRLNR